MTREEAIKSALKYLVRKQQEQGSWGYADNDNTNKVSWNEVLEWIDQQPCGDLISRQAVIDTIETDCSWDIFNEWGSRTPTGECIINAIKSVPSVETERCGDCISRNAIIETLNEMDRYIANELTLCKSNNKFPQNEVFIVDDVYEQIAEELPSVEPERKTGKWIKVVNPDTNEWAGGFKCSECDRDCIQMSMNYCANCGAPMKEEEE